MGWKMKSKQRMNKLLHGWLSTGIFPVQAKL